MVLGDKYIKFNGVRCNTKHADLHPLSSGHSSHPFGRKPRAPNSALHLSKSKVDNLCLQQLIMLAGGWLPELIASFKPTHGDNSRDRVYTIAVTFWAFLSQVLDPAGLCLRAVCRLKSLLSSRNFELPEEDTAAYCRARARLPIKLLVRVARGMAQLVCACKGYSTKGRVLVMDGTGITLQDTRANSLSYAYGPSQKPGCGFPLMKCQKTGYSGPAAGGRGCRPWF